MARAATTTDVFNALGDGSRRQILEALSMGEAGVGEIVDRLHLGQPQVSKHLKVLRHVGLVRCRNEGRNHVYRVDAAGLQPLQTWLARLTADVNEHYDRLDDYLAEIQRNQAHKEQP
jgi:DNA-binding transcriptional ArsR family regulator